MIYISKPNIEKVEDGKIKFYIDVRGLEVSKIWFKMPEFVKPYIDINDCSAFLVALLPQLCYMGEDIFIEGGISASLYNNIKNKLFPLWNKYSRIFQEITIKVDSFIEDRMEKNQNRHIGTGISCGVDSLDTIKSGLCFEEESRIDVLTFFNTGSHRSTGGLSYEESLNLYYERMKRSKACAKELGLNFLWIDSNIGECLKTKYVQVHQFCNFSAVLACGSYFSKYYYASGYPLDMFNIANIDIDTAYYETYLCQLLSTDLVRFSINGECNSRLDKVKNIADMPIAQKYLNVCFMKDKNCGICEKCVRTQMELYAIGKLYAFSEVFDINKFYSNIDKHLKTIYRLKFTNVYKEIIDCMKSNGIKVPLKYRLYGGIRQCLHNIKQSFNKLSMEK